MKVPSPCYLCLLAAVVSGYAKTAAPGPPLLQRTGHTFVLEAPSHLRPHLEWNHISIATTRCPAPRLLHHRESHDHEAWKRGWSTVEREVCLDLPTTFPADISGTYYHNGPGRFHRGNDQVMHPWDADGMVRAVTFHNGKAWFRNRFVRTPGYVEEEREQKICYRGVFGTPKNKGKLVSNILDLRTKNVANTNVLCHNNQVYALWEAARPTEIDPVTLVTKGERRQFGNRYSAHYKEDSKTGSICNFCIHFCFPDPSKKHRLTVMEHDKEGKLLYQHEHILPGLAIGHDMTITDNYFCFFRSPTKFNPLPFLLGQKGPAQCFEWDDTAKTAQVHLVQRGRSHTKPITIEVPPCFCFHFSNAFEDSDGSVVIDVITADRMFMADTDSYHQRPITETMDYNQLPDFQLVRYRVNTRTRRLVSCRSMSAGAANVDFPVIHPHSTARPYKSVFMGCNANPSKMGPIQGLCKVDVERGVMVEKWLPKPQEFLSEVVMTPRSDREDDAYLIGYLLDGKAKSTSLVVFDAENISQGPIVQSDLGILLPHPLHGTFCDGFTPKLTDAVRASFR